MANKPSGGGNKPSGGGASQRMAAVGKNKDKNKDKSGGGLKVKTMATQAFQTMMAINELGSAQNQAEMTHAARLDEQLSESNLSRAIELGESTGAQERFNLREQGTQSRANILAGGEQERATLGTRGEQERLTQAQRYAGETGLIRTTGEESRKGTETTGTQQRLTDLQQEMFRRYKENRDYEQAQRQYRT